MKNIIKNICAFSILLMATSCYDYIDIEEKGKNRVTQAEDIELLLNDSSTKNFSKNYEALFIGDDVYEFTDEFQPYGIPIVYPVAEALMFEDFLFDETEATNFTSYQSLYENINIANIVLENVRSVNGSAEELNTLEGRAYAIRANNLLEIVNLYSRHYSQDYANEENSGVVIPESSLSDYVLKRATLQECYDAIISDLENAIALLPDAAPPFNDRIYKQGAYGLLARTCLLMGDWAKAEENASNALALNGALYDYKNDVTFVPAFGSFPDSYELPHGSNIATDKEAIVFEVIGGAFQPLPNIVANPDLVAMYEDTDIRKRKFFDPSTNMFVGRSGYNAFFRAPGRVNCGVNIPEMYLIRAEANARMGNGASALDDLNFLRSHRYEDGYVDLTDVGMALQYTKEERRRELAFSQWRIVDIKRYNLIDNDNISVTHRNSAADITYTLNPGDLNSVLPIPRAVISDSPLVQIVQNPRDGN